LIEVYRTKGLHHAREVNRAHVLSALDRGVPEAQIMAVLGVGRTVYLADAERIPGRAERNLRCTMLHVSGKPRQYDTDVEAQDFRLGLLGAAGGCCSAGRLPCWSKPHKTQAGFGPISRETVRRLLKKTASSRGAS
jgi:hypothetical protein